VKLDSAISLSQDGSAARAHESHEEWKKMGNYILPWYSSEQSVFGYSKAYGVDAVNSGYPGHCIPMTSVFA